MANSPLDIIPREPLAPNVDMSPRWRRWFEQFQRMLGNIGGLPWIVVDKTDSSLTDIATREHGQLQKVYGVTGGELVEDPEKVLHVSKSDVSRWDSASGGNTSLFFWLFGG